MKKIVFIILFFCMFSVHANEKVKVDLKSCVDGDTANFIMKKKNIKVRFLAIDAPEIKHGSKKADPFGNEAAEYTCSELKKAQKIDIEFDNSSNKKDRYDRYLAWIFVDDVLLQDKIIKKGFAKVAYVYGNYKYVDTLNTSERISKSQRKGIWGNKKSEINFEFIRSNYVYIIISILILLLICIINKKARKHIKKKILRKIKW